MKSSLLKFIAVLAAFSLACQVSVNLPISQTGETNTFSINEPAPPAGQTARVVLEMAGGVLNLTRGSDQLVSGTITYNLTEWQPVVERNDETVRIRQDIDTVPFTLGDDDMLNRWELQLGNTPMELEINAGAYEGNLELGGVPLSRLEIRGGASDTAISFNELNPQEMTVFEVRTGASNIELQNLANANFREMDFSGAAGSYRFDFNGNLQREANIDISSAAGNLTIIIPAERAAQVAVTGGLRDVDIRGRWDVVDGVYSLPGSGPLLDISVEMSVGNLELISE